MDLHPVFPNVFRPLTIGRTQVRNRIFVPAHTTNFGDNNLPSARHLAYHQARAAGGVGLIIFEGIRVHKSSLGRQQGVNGYEREAIPKFREIANAVQGEGAKLFGQVLHLGRHIDGNFARMAAWSASSIPWTATAPAPHPMTKDEIKLVVKAHADVAVNLLDAGLDGIELQLAHGHLLQQFLSPIANQREDEYGGSLENRLRIVLETAEAVRHAMGATQTLGIRVSADEFLAGGLTLDDMCKIVPVIANAVPLDFVNVSHSAYHGSYTISTQMADMAFPNEQFRYLTDAMSSALDGLQKKPIVMSVCRYNRIELAEGMLASGKADMIGMARAHIADPEIVKKAFDGRVDETIPCIGCNQGCADMLAQSLAITCLANPRTGREREWPCSPGVMTEVKKPLLVIGGGPGGMQAALMAAQRGCAVTLVDLKDELGGTLNYLKKMPLRKEFLNFVEWQKRRVHETGVRLELNLTADATLLAAYADHEIIWAAGAKPAAQPLQGKAQALTLEAALTHPNSLGNRVLIVDHLGTWSVVSVAEYLADSGLEVTLVVPTGIAAWKVSVYSSFALRDRLKKKKVRILGGYRLRHFEAGVAELEDLSLSESVHSVKADSVIAPIASTPNIPPDIGRLIVSVGDSVSARTALEAVYEGHEAGLSMGLQVASPGNVATIGN